MKRNSDSEELKIILLFDALDKMDQYDEERLLRKQQEYQEAATFKSQGTFI